MLKKLLRYTPLLLLLLMGSGSLLWCLNAGVSPGALLLSLHDEFQAFVDTSFWLAAVIYLCAYVLVVAVALPGGMIMTLAGGYLFGPILGFLFASLGAYIGASLTFIAVRLAFGESLFKVLGPQSDKFRQLFMKSPIRNLLLLRLCSVVPFFMINIAAALFGVRYTVFLWTMVLGMIPSIMAFCLIGSGLNAQLVGNGLPGFEVLLEPIFIVPSLMLLMLIIISNKVRRFI